MENLFHPVQSVWSGYLVPDGNDQYQVMDGICKVDIPSLSSLGF